MALFGLIGKKKKKYKMSKSQKALMAQQEQLAALANERLRPCLTGRTPTGSGRKMQPMRA